jgi:P-type Ca2+ transporter type 2C
VEKLPKKLPGYSNDLEEVINSLQTDIRTGLEATNAYERKIQFGPNKIITPKPNFWVVYLAPLFDTLIVIYLIMTAVLFLFSILVPDVRNQVMFWLGFISLNMALAIFQQYRAQKKVEALQNLSPPKSMVIRDGLKFEVLAQNLVVGDIIELNLGDRIPADARLIECHNFGVNEASLTGEPVAVTKDTQLDKALDEDTPISLRKNMVYLGTFVQTGSAKAIITAVGNDTELGQIATSMGEMHTLEIPLRSRVNAIGRGLGTTMVLFLFTLIIYRSVTFTPPEGQESLTIDNFAFIVTRSIITAMAVMPINIPLLTTVVLITGVLNMAKNNVIVKQLAVVETLGRTSVLCSDKTGTMTTSKMTVVQIWDGQDFYTVDENHSNHLMKENTEEVVNVKEHELLDKIISSGILNNEATLSEEEDGRFEVIGNATDGALLLLGIKTKYDIYSLNQNHQQLRKYPFDSALKRMSGIFEDKNTSELMVYSKGATDVLLNYCTHYRKDGKLTKIVKKRRDSIMQEVNRFANQGFRIVSLAYKPIDEILEFEDTDEERSWVESELIYLGFMCILDPPRAGVNEAVARLDEAGIFPIMITGDAPTTAGTIAEKVGVLDPDELVVEGKDIKNLSDEEFFKVSVFARVSPQDKQVIVDRYQKRGDVVTMTGDGVNDALAITLADAGVAMGITGTEVAKEAADLIISDDSYVSLVNGVAEGRNLYEKIRIMIFFFIAVNIAEAIMYFSSAFVMDFFLSDVQRIYIFGIVHAIPPLAIIFGKEDKEIMKLQPRQQSNLIPKKLLEMMIIFVLVFAGILLAIYAIYFNGILGLNSINTWRIEYIVTGTDQAARSDEMAKARTMLLSVLYIVECFIIHSIRRVNNNFVENMKDATIFIWIMVLFPLILHIVLMYSPLQFILGDNIGLVALSFTDWLLVILFSAIPLGVLELHKFYMRKTDQQY